MSSRLLAANKLRRKDVGASLGIGVALALVLAAGLLSVVATRSNAAEACANEAIRSEQGAAAMSLPDCRAYELVSSSGSVPAIGGLSAIAADNGERFAYSVNQPAPSSDAEGVSLLATRGANGWSVQNVTPRQGGRRSDQFACAPSMFFSADLSEGILSDGWLVVSEGIEKVCEGDDPPLVAEEPRGVANLFLRDNEDGSYGLIDEVPTGVTPANALLEDATPDLDGVVFAEGAALTPEAPAGLDLYEWMGGADRLVSLLPDGEAVPGQLVNSQRGSATFTHAVSTSGETVFFNYGDGLFARLHAMRESAIGGTCSESKMDKACTIQVDAAAPEAAGPGGGGTFAYASENGSRIFFTDSNRLTANSTTKPEEPDLYEYDVESGSLTDLTASTAGPANVLGFSGASANGAYVYFVARGVLTGEQVNGYGEAAIRRRPNLYLSHAGVTTFIATLEGNGSSSDSDKGDWQESISGRDEGNLTTRVSPNGAYLAFNSVRPLTDYDSEPLEPQDCEDDRCSEIFLYNTDENKLTCVSCAADEAAPTGSARIGEPTSELEIPASPRYLQRYLLEDGDVFFDTSSALVPQATNGAVNVYEYEGGEAHLISSGTSSGASTFLDASAGGEDVFFATAQGLVQSDTDNADSVYDARVDGGFPASVGEASTAPTCESAEACKAPPSEPAAQMFPASSVLAGNENLTAPPVPVTPPPPAERAATKRSLTRAQKLARALKVCTRKSKRERAACERAARKRYAKAGARATRKRDGKTSGDRDRRRGQ